MKKLLQKEAGFLRSFKAVYVANNLLHLHQLQHNRALYQKFGLKKPVYAPISSQDFKHLPPSLLLGLTGQTRNSNWKANLKNLLSQHPCRNRYRGGQQTAI